MTEKVTIRQSEPDKDRIRQKDSVKHNIYNARQIYREKKRDRVM